MNDEQRKRMAEKSGDNNSSRPPKYVVPLIRFNGNTGEYRKVSKDKDGNNVDEPIRAPFHFVILKKRRLLSAFSTNQSYFTNEHNNTNDKLMLFKFVGGTVTLEDINYTAELRNKYQTLKTHEVIYVLYDGEVCRMEIKGGSLGGYYDYQKALSSEEKHSFEVNTVMGSKKTKNEAGFSYYEMTFDFVSSDVDFDIVEAKMDEVSKACQEADAYTKFKLMEKTKGSVNGDVTMAGVGMPTGVSQSLAKKAEDEFNNYGKSSDDINPNDIPF